MHQHYIMITTSNPQYGHFVVRKCCVTKNSRTYGIFRINHARNSYDDPENTDPRKAFKIDLEPVGKTDFVRKDWYVSGTISEREQKACRYQSFDNYYEALNWAESMNNMK